MTRAWRIYFGAVTVLFVYLAGLGFLVSADQRRFEASMNAKLARGATRTAATGPIGMHGLVFNPLAVKAHPPAMGDYPEIR